MSVSKEQAITRRRDEWISIVNQRDLEAYVSLLSDNVLWIPPGQPPLMGRQEFREWVKPFLERFRYKFDIRNPIVRVIGDWAIERGTFHTVLTPESGPPTEHGGRYLLFWHRGEDDAWYIERYLDETPV